MSEHPSGMTLRDFCNREGLDLSEEELEREEKVVQAMCAEAGSQVDWASVQTQRQAEETAIRRLTERLCDDLEGFSYETQALADSPSEITPAAVAGTLSGMADKLLELAGLFRSHLAAVDLDDQTKVVAISGGEITHNFTMRDGMTRVD